MNAKNKLHTKTESQVVEEKPPLALEELINYERFLLMTTEKTTQEAKKYTAIMNDLIAQLEANLTAIDKQNQEYRQILQDNDQEFQRLAQEQRSEEHLKKAIEPEMQTLEKNKNHAKIKKLQYLQSCSELKKLQWQYSQEQQYFRTAETHLKAKQSALQELRTTIQMQDKQQNRLYKLLNQYEAQNEEMFTLKKKLNNDLQQIKGNIRVYCRVRPRKSQNGIIAVTSDNTLKIAYERERNRNQTERYEQGYVFEQIFGEHQTQHTIFTELSQLVQNSIDGKNVCIFAYGQTGSGKTYTLLGPQEEGKSREQIYEQRGIAPRSFQQIFKQIEMSRKFKWHFKAYLSIQEIYLENIIDLIAKAETVKDKSTEVQVKEVEQVLAFLKEASLNRKKAATNMNQRSSRSHLIITLRLEGFSEKNEDRRQGSLVFVDLAGSERLKQSKVEGQLLKETQFINKSLSALGTVINQMRKASEHVSFRNSKLTYVLQRYLQGQSKTLMFVNVSPDHPDMSQTKISLGFAQNVRECKVKK